MGMNVLKTGQCVPNCDYSNELPGFIRCEKSLNDQNSRYYLKKQFVYGISSVLLAASVFSHKAEHCAVPTWR